MNNEECVDAEWLYNQKVEGNPTYSHNNSIHIFGGKLMQKLIQC